MTSPLKIRDGHASINNDETVYLPPSGTIEIIGDKNAALFSVTRIPNGISISCSGVIKFDQGKSLLGDHIFVRPICSNVVEVLREEYK